MTSAKPYSAAQLAAIRDSLNAEREEWGRVSEIAHVIAMRKMLATLAAVEAERDNLQARCDMRSEAIQNQHASLAAALALLREAREMHEEQEYIHSAAWNDWGDRIDALLAQHQNKEGSGAVHLDARPVGAGTGPSPTPKWLERNEP